MSEPKRYYWIGRFDFISDYFIEIAYALDSYVHIQGIKNIFIDSLWTQKNEDGTWTCGFTGTAHDRQKFITLGDGREFPIGSDNGVFEPSVIFQRVEEKDYFPQ